MAAASKRIGSCVKQLVVRVVLADDEIPAPIISPVSVDMMNTGAARERPSEDSFCD
jgi:hypothetical protein